MNIESAKYMKDMDTKKVHQVKATVDGVEWFVPLSTSNRHYQAILEWAKIDGNTIEEAD